MKDSFNFVLSICFLLNLIYWYIEMSKLTFQQFLKDNSFKKQQEEEEKFNPEKEKAEWLAFIDSFYKKIEAWLAPFIENKDMTISYVQKTITEEEIGSYSVNNMNLNFAGQHLTFEPIGTLLIGTKGRIDLNGPKGVIKFILVDKDSTELKIKITVNQSVETTTETDKTPKWTWKIIEHAPSKIKYIDLTEENFFDALMELVNG